MTRKIAISLPDSTLRKARMGATRRRAPSLSNYIARLVEEASAAESFEDMISEWLKESGARAEEIRAAERESAAAFRRAGLLPPGRGREKAKRQAG
jgi:hypothetical protein